VLAYRLAFDGVEKGNLDKRNFMLVPAARRYDKSYRPVNDT
jgi:hypothetical protein